jgi:hypothetical protein
MKVLPCFNAVFQNGYAVTGESHQNLVSIANLLREKPNTRSSEYSTEFTITRAAFVFPLHQAAEQMSPHNVYLFVYANLFCFTIYLVQINTLKPSDNDMKHLL